MHRSGASRGGMQTLAHALLNQISEDSDLGKMVSKAKIKTKLVRKKTKIKVVTDPSKRYHTTIRKTAWLGIGSLRPCSLLTWRPGRPVLADGKPGRIKWGLSDGNLEFVVVLFDVPQTLYGTDSTTEYGCIPVSYLTRCDCAGYLHKKHCRP